ncbi:MAG: hypothetical protein R6U29_01510 [Desulfosudaceae bacterium]
MKIISFIEEQAAIKQILKALGPVVDPQHRPAVHAESEYRPGTDASLPKAHQHMVARKILTHNADLAIDDDRKSKFLSIIIHSADETKLIC